MDKLLVTLTPLAQVLPLKANAIPKLELDCVNDALAYGLENNYV